MNESKQTLIQRAKEITKCDTFEINQTEQCQ